MKRILFLFCTIPVLLVSCTVQPLPGMELSRRLIVEAIGIDAAETGVKLTLETIDPSAQQTDTAEGKKWITYSFTAGSVAEAAAVAAQRTGKTPFFAYAGVLLFGKETVQKGLTPYLDFFLRNRTVRNTVNVCVAAGSAESLLTTASMPSASPAETIQDTLLAGKETGRCAAAAFFQFANRMLSPDTEAYCPLVRAAAPDADEPAPFSCTDTAVFTGDRFRFSLGSAETQTFLLLTNAVRDGLFRADSGDTVYDCRLQQAKTQLRINRKNPAEEISISLRARAEIVEINSVLVLPASETDRSKAKRALQTGLLHAIEHCLDIIYTKNGTDLLRIRKRSGVSLTVPPNSLCFICTAEIAFR